jgi:uncharacterized protein YlxW (UPF0749 family)
MVGVILGAAALVAAVGLFVSQAGIRRRLMIVRGKAGEADVIAAVARQVEEVRALRGDIRTLGQQIAALAESLQGAVQLFAVHRYDAFEDMGGKLSFSAALLNAHGDGVVISSINGRQEARSYAKPVAHGRSVYNLSPEEQEAIRQAMNGGRAR